MIDCMPFNPTIAALEVTLMRVPPDTNVHAEKLPDSKPSAKILSLDGVAVFVEVGDGDDVVVGDGVLVGVKVGEGVEIGRASCRERVYSSV